MSRPRPAVFTDRGRLVLATIATVAAALILALTSATPPCSASDEPAQPAPSEIAAR